MNARDKAINEISSKLNQKGDLTDEDISKEVERFKKLYSIDEYRNYLLENIDGVLDDDIFEGIERELREKFNTKMDRANILQGLDQQDRDTTWWTSRIKNSKENYYWDRYKELLSNNFSNKIVKTYDDDSDDILNNLGDPSNSKFGHYGMVVGHVQSGKTNNYSSVLCKAADAGYKVIIVIAGGINNLRNQTQERINEAFIGIERDGKEVGVGKDNDRPEKLPISLTTELTDFNKRDADRLSLGMNLDNTTSPIVLVIKKNTSTLKNVHRWLKNHYGSRIEKHAMLLIDDESDYATINYKDEDDPTKINEGIRKLLGIFKKRNYLAYTATPFANIFIDHLARNENQGDDLFPKDFICTLDPASTYQGARKIFIESNDQHVIEINDYIESFPSNHKKDHQIDSLPDSLKEAINLFLLNIVERERRGQIKKHNSMLVHTSRFTNVHKEVAFKIDNMLTSIKNDLLNFGKLENAYVHSEKILFLKKLYSKHFNDDDWLIALDKLVSIISTVIVREVHQSAKIKLTYQKLDNPKNVNTNAIVVGGTSLSRGFTLEGLSVSYFLRNTRFYDTLMQMGRWFGYRPGYEDLCKVYIPQVIAANYADVIEIIEELYDSFKKMHIMQRTPNDFGLFVKRHPDSALQITARNKMRNVQDLIVEMNLNGSLKESAWLPKDENSRSKNYSLISNFINHLNAVASYSNKKSNHIWHDIPKGDILNLLNDFKLYSSDPYGLKARMPIEFIKKYIQNDDKNWDVALYSGNGRPCNIADRSINLEQRKALLKEDYIEINNRRISSGDVGKAESIVLNNPPKGKYEIRKKMKKPLLMLHLLELKGEDFTNKPYPAIGVCIPGDPISSGCTSETISVNTVWQLEFDEEDFIYDD